MKRSSRSDIGERVARQKAGPVVSLALAAASASCASSRDLPIEHPSTVHASAPLPRTWRAALLPHSTAPTPNQPTSLLAGDGGVCLVDVHDTLCCYAGNLRARIDHKTVHWAAQATATRIIGATLDDGRLYLATRDGGFFAASDCIGDLRSVGDTAGEELRSSYWSYGRLIAISASGAVWFGGPDGQYRRELPGRVAHRRVSLR